MIGHNCRPFVLCSGPGEVGIISEKFDSKEGSLPGRLSMHDEDREVCREWIKNGVQGLVLLHSCIVIG